MRTWSILGGRLIRIVASCGLLILISVGLNGSPAEALDGKSYECYRADYGCVEGTGYAGVSAYGYPGPHNCTLYAAFRIAANGYPNPSGLGNAYDWDEQARAQGVPVNGTPTVGSIAQTDAGPGHVMYVESVTAGHITVTEDNWEGGTGRALITRGSAYYNSLEFIHFADVGGPSSDGVPLENYARNGGFDHRTARWSAVNANLVTRNDSDAYSGVGYGRTNTASGGYIRNDYALAIDSTDHFYATGDHTSLSARIYPTTGGPTVSIDTVDVH